MRRDYLIGRALRRHGRDAFDAEVLLVGSEDYCYAMERALIAAQGTLVPSGYKVADGGDGFTSDDAHRLNFGHHPNLRAARTEALERGRSAMSCRAGNPNQLALAALRVHPDGLTAAQLVTFMPPPGRGAGTASQRAGGSIHRLRCQGHKIISTGGPGKAGVYRLIEDHGACATAAAAGQPT
ncbi:MAG: hypothetical protein D6763_04965 [Alphaproteobacteria bacterium]|nr:MAG: hypothetical protein D6763_04965 [Alphaproteobacteria bacterium]